MNTIRKFRVGDWVEVRTKAEILQSLDSAGRLEGMPFMPEMFAFCGKRFQVDKIAHKTCDYTVPKVYRSGRLAHTVHLNTRCDGSAHDGCQASCLLYWKEVWLRRVDNSGTAVAPQPDEPCGEVSNQARKSNHGCTENDVWAHVKVQRAQEESPTYICQMTQTPFATTPLAWWDIRQYFQDYLSGNVGLRRMLSGAIYWAYYSLSEAGIGVGRPMRWIYDKLCPLWGRTRFPRTPGLIPEGQATPLVRLNLQPGELVRVKSHSEILQTVNTSNSNRGMYWDAELTPYCGGTYTVLQRVNKIISEGTGKMVEMKSACIILDSVICQARYSSCRMFCPKSMYPYWREIWLERVAPESSNSPEVEEPREVPLPIDG